MTDSESKCQGEDEEEEREGNTELVHVRACFPQSIIVGRGCGKKWVHPRTATKTLVLST
jgi:hypothetical protein